MTRRPYHEIRYGLIKVRIWKRKSNESESYSLSVIRLYRNGVVWKESMRFDRDDLPLVRLALNEAYGWLLTTGRTGE